jgi:hypothetical protein
MSRYSGYTVAGAAPVTKASASTSCFISLSALFILCTTGCGGSHDPNGPPPPPLKGQLYVAKPAPAKILRFRAGDSGDVSPQALGTPSVPSGALGGAAVDVMNDRLAVASSATTSPGSVTLIDHVSTAFCPAGCSGIVRVISGPATTLSGIGTPPALDGKHDLLYVLNFPGGGSPPNIVVFGPASTITGNVAPQRTLTTTFTIGELVLDPGNDRLFVIDKTNQAVAVFDGASTLNGAVVPNRVIAGPATQISAPFHLALDNTASLLVVDLGAQIASVPHILVFNNPGTANGNIAPMASSILADQTDQPLQIAVSPDGELFTVKGSKIEVYSNIAASSGNLGPSRVISGPNTQLDDFAVPTVILGVAVDPTR